MREIKFRAWDEKDGMFNVYGFDFSDKSVIHPNGLNYYDCKVMQFTGLKDKNGKEIYEGDRVDTRYGKFTVTWNDNCSGFEPFTFAANAPDSDTETEVIGNIYENPELLDSMRGGG